jgi:asparagine synthase (glutamine-hydrolysing)
MCGISGIFNLYNKAPISSEQLRVMAFSLNHRGPDEAGAYVDDFIGLAQSRLSIIDLTGGSQPIHNEDKSLWIIFNGEIFNYPELRAELIKLGHKFYTNTDTEVILHLYEEKKEKALDDLNGQFAFAIWDSNNHELFLARDRVGILPLYFKLDREKFYFASELKAIFSVQETNPAFDPIGFDQIFTFWTNLPGDTPFKDYKEIPPAHFLRINFNGKFELKPYWHLKFSEEKKLSDRKINDITHEAQELLTDAVRIRLRADVPVGSYLSGGLDSSGLTAIVKKKFNNELRTFGISFEEESFDESRFQKLMVEHLQTNHSEVFAKNSDIGKYFSDIVYFGERPIFRTAPAPLYLLSKKVREENFKVVLTGEGADEIFGGYNIFKEAKIRKFWSANPESKYRSKLLKKLYPYIFKDKRLFSTLEAFFRLGIDEPENPIFSHIVRWSNNSKMKNFFSENFKEHIKDYNAIDELLLKLPDNFDDWETLSKAQYLEIITFMSGYLLSSQGDRMAMGNSVELRVPYLDHRLIEFMSTVPSAYKILGLNEKYILKKVFKEYLPKEILYRAKNPYRAPIRNSFIANNNFPIEDILDEARISESGVFNPTKVNLLLQKAKKSESLSELDNMALAGIISTQLLYNHILSPKKTAVPTKYGFKIFIDKRTNN